MPGPLDGIRVLDWTIWQMGPVAGALLGDLGAEVIKIESRDGDPGRALKRARGVDWFLPHDRNIYFENNNRNKKSIAVDLTRPEGKEIIYRLAPRCDVFLQNFRYGVAARLGLDYETLSQYNPRLIYASGSGYGAKGPDRAQPAFDYVGLARSGIMPLVPDPGQPPAGLPGGVADQMGAIMLAYAILAALVARERQGIGQQLDVSHLGSMLCLQGLSISLWGMAEKEPARQVRSSAPNPLWNHYQCRDGRWLALSHLQPDRYWANFCKAIGRPELGADPRFVDAAAREQHCAGAVAILDAVFITKTCQEWIDTLNANGDFIFTPINSIADVFQDPQALENEYIVSFDHPVLGPVRMAGFPAQFAKTPASIRTVAPTLGEHADELLTQLAGYTPDEIARLRESRVI